MFNAFALGDRELTVNLAKPREERGSGGFGNRGGAFGSPGGGASKGHARRGGNRRY
jgi:hypothetical protein